MILAIKVTVIITIILTIIIKCRGKYRTLRTTNTKLLMTLHNGQNTVNNSKKNSPTDAVRVLDTTQKPLIHHLRFRNDQSCLPLSLIV